MVFSQSSQSAPASAGAIPAAGASVRRGVADRVSERLAQSPYFPVRGVWCDYHEGVLCLRGRVPSYYLKQIAQTIACQVEGVEECMNRIEVGSATSVQPATTRQRIEPAQD
ncbi:MAG: BON domain-containing protein [Planctomycetaceae bacterium]|nr:BON domain-containing protein [Planctomycetaceae bacterium]